MIKREISAAIAAGALLLTGCADKKAANEANFKAAVEEAVKAQSVCMQFSRIFDPTSGIPVDLPPTSHPSDDAVLAQADTLLKALADLQLVTLQVVHKPEPGPFGRANAPYITVKVTDKGKPYAKNVGRMPSLCFGRLVVDSVDRFSAPTSMMGHTVSEVHYSYHVEDLPDWAHDPRLVAEDAELRQLLRTKQQSDKTVLVLTDKGWEDQRVAGF
jgi:hypothetical protein